MRSIIVFDGMAIVTKIDIKKSNIKVCKEFATNFVNIINQESQGFDDISIGHLMTKQFLSSIENKNELTF